MLSSVAQLFLIVTTSEALLSQTYASGSHYPLLNGGGDDIIYPIDPLPNREKYTGGIAEHSRYSSADSRRLLFRFVVHSKE